MKNVLKRLVRVGCMAVAVFCIAACDSDLDIQTAYPFHVETMPVPLRVTQGETVEIRCSLLAEGRTSDTQLKERALFALSYVYLHPDRWCEFEWDGNLGDLVRKPSPQTSQYK